MFRFVFQLRRGHHPRDHEGQHEDLQGCDQGRRQDGGMYEIQVQDAKTFRQQEELISPTPAACHYWIRYLFVNLTYLFC